MKIEWTATSQDEVGRSHAEEGPGSIEKRLRSMLAGDVMVQRISGGSNG